MNAGKIGLATAPVLVLWIGVTEIHHWRAREEWSAEVERWRSRATVPVAGPSRDAPPRARSPVPTIEDFVPESASSTSSSSVAARRSPANDGLASDPALVEPGTLILDDEEQLLDGERDFLRDNPPMDGAILVRGIHGSLGMLFLSRMRGGEVEHLRVTPENHSLVSEYARELAEITEVQSHVIPIDLAERGDAEIFESWDEAQQVLADLRAADPSANWELADTDIGAILHRSRDVADHWRSKAAWASIRTLQSHLMPELDGTVALAVSWSAPDSF
ncbi:MAG: hypothetical protein KDC38_17540 [Planctomycetes bacterium]|nr:hypothetical protein [Planctomycetota bacterium]